MIGYQHFGGLCCLKMEAALLSKMLVSYHITTQYCNPEDQNMILHCCENLEYCIRCFFIAYSCKYIAECCCYLSIHSVLNLLSIITKFHLHNGLTVFRVTACSLQLFTAVDIQGTKGGNSQGDF
jgi:hypothetical protein